MTILDAVPDREPVELAEGHPWQGIALRPAWVRYRDDEGRVVLAWRPHMPEAWPVVESRS